MKADPVTMSPGSTVRVEFGLISKGQRQVICGGDGRAQPAVEVPNCPARCEPGQADHVVVPNDQTIDRSALGSQ